MHLHNLLYPNCHNRKKGRILAAACTALLVSVGIFLLYNLNYSPVSEMFSNVFFTNELQIKTIKVNDPPEEEEMDYYYEEYMDGYWWRGTLLADMSSSTDSLNMIGTSPKL